MLLVISDLKIDLCVYWTKKKNTLTTILGFLLKLLCARMGLCVFERDYLMIPLIVQEATLTMRKEIQDLRTNARIFQLSKCTACTFTLDLPAVHFMCIHSFHQRCLGDNEKECPVCAPEYRSVLEMKTSLEQNSKDQDRFFQQVKSSKDGFSVIAEYFGKGVISKTSNGPSS